MNDGRQVELFSSLGREPMRLRDLPVAEEGDWGVVVVDDDDRRFVAEYDDDEEEGAIVYALDSWREGPMTVPYWSMRRIPVDCPWSRLFRPVFLSACERHVLEADELIYALAPNPDLSLSRIKIGKTARLKGRLAQYRTANPGLLVLALWPGERTEERTALSVARRFGTMIGPEVFDFPEPFEALAAIGSAIGGTPYQ